MSRFWGWFERLTIAVVLLLMVAVQIIVANAVFKTMSQEMTEVFAFTFNVLGLLVMVLLVAAFSGLVVDLVRWAASVPLSDHAEWTLNCVVGLAATAILAYHVLSMSASYNLNPGFAEAQFVLGWVFVLAFAMKARPIRTALMLISRRQERKEAAA